MASSRRPGGLSRPLRATADVPKSAELGLVSPFLPSRWAVGQPLTVPTAIVSRSRPVRGTGRGAGRSRRGSASIALRRANSEARHRTWPDALRVDDACRWRQRRLSDGGLYGWVSSRCGGCTWSTLADVCGRVRALRARHASHCKALRGINRSCPSGSARRQAVRALQALGTHSLFHGALSARRPGASLTQRTPSSHEDRSHRDSSRLRRCSRTASGARRRELTSENAPLNPESRLAIYMPQEGEAGQGK